MTQDSSMPFIASLLRLQRRLLVATAPRQQRIQWALAEVGRLTGAMVIAECVAVGPARPRLMTNAHPPHAPLQQLLGQTAAMLLNSGSLDDLLGAVGATPGNSSEVNGGLAPVLLQSGVSMLVISVVRAEKSKGILLAAFDPPHANDEHGRMAASLFRLAHPMIIAPVSCGDCEPLSDMTGRPAEVAQLLLKGYSEKEIAGILGISPTTVHTYVVMVYRHYGVHSRAELSYRLLGPSSSESNGSIADTAAVLYCGHVHLKDRVHADPVLVASNPGLPRLRRALRQTGTSPSTDFDPRSEPR